MISTMGVQKGSPTVFGNRLIAVRKAQGVTQVELAQAVGVTQRGISYYEARGGNPTLDMIVKLANALDVSSDVLLGIKSADEIPVQPSDVRTVDERRLWKRFRQLMRVPEKDRRAILRMLDSMAKAKPEDPARSSS
jgi:transcriptional regulator with XRE-family HTH domain